MACHQAHNIPWATLASHFKYSYCPAGHGGCTNIYPRFDKSQGRELHYFVTAFARNIQSHTEVESHKYPEAAEPPDDDPTILTTDVINRIAPNVRHAAKGVMFWQKFSEHPSTIPVTYTKARAFLHSSESNGWRGEDVFYSLELFKLLILHGEMTTLQQICQHPRAAWEQAWEKHYDAFGDQNTCGWAYVPRLALKAYLTLNLLLCFPQLWDDDSGRSDTADYRNTRCYQLMLRECTLSDLSTNIAALPHRQFFGVSDEQFKHYPYSTHAGKHSHLLGGSSRKEYPYGLIPILDFLELESPYVHMATVAHVQQVRWYLCRLGLPTELALHVMEIADYQATAHLDHPLDPLHPTNRGELRRYLDYCWNIIVRCDLLGEWLGDKIPWDRMVAETLVQLVGDGTNQGRRFYDCRFDENAQGFNYHESSIYTFL